MFKNGVSKILFAGLRSNPKTFPVKIRCFLKINPLRGSASSGLRGFCGLFFFFHLVRESDVARACEMAKNTQTQHTNCAVGTRHVAAFNVSLSILRQKAANKITHYKIKYLNIFFKQVIFFSFFWVKNWTISATLKQKSKAGGTFFWADHAYRLRNRADVTSSRYYIPVHEQKSSIQWWLDRRDRFIWKL